MRISFAQKLSLLMVGLIVVTGAMLTGVSAYQFREDLVREEVRSAYTVYLSVINYLAGHSKSHNGRFVPEILDFVLEERFLNAGGNVLGDETPRLTALAVFGERGDEYYQFVRSDLDRPVRLVPPDTSARVFRIALNIRGGRLRASGPISVTGDVPGWVVMDMPTAIQTRINALYIKAAATLIGIGLIGTVLSVYAARRFLAPVQAVIQATSHIREGDFSIQVREDYHDEIGQMARAFNQMVRSISRRVSTMGRIHDWSLRLGKEMDIDRLLELMARMFKELGQATRTSVWYRTQAGEVTRVTSVGSGEAGPDADAVAALPSSLLDALGRGEVLVWREGVLAPPDRGGNEPPRGLLLPLYRDPRGAGFLAAGPREDGRGYDPELVSMLANLAQNAGLIIDNARLYTELKEQERIQQEMNWAREIQESLLPRCSPTLPGYEVHGVSHPAREVGGDYFDYIPGRDASLFHLIIGDVSGKGVPAGLIMSVVRSLVHSYCEFEQGPGTILKRVNRTLTVDLEPEMFVTASMLTVDFSSHTLRMVRAGHEPALLVRGDGAVTQLHPRGTALGLSDLAHYDESSEELVYGLGQGELVVLYTDGITEAQNPAGQEFGLERLVDCIRRYRNDPLPGLTQQILRAVADFSRGREQLDDITLLALRRVRQ